MKQLIGLSILIVALLACLTFLAMINGVSFWAALLFGVGFLSFIAILIFAISLIQG